MYRILAAVSRKTKKEIGGQYYEGHSEMFWTHLICGSLIILRLNIKKLLAQHVSRQGY